MSDHVSLRIALLDNQIVDAERLPIGRVDDIDIELSDQPGGRPRVAGLLIGAQALGERLGGLGDAVARAAQRLRGPDGPPGPARVEPGLVDGLDPFIRLGIALGELRDVALLERWLARHLVERVPGAGDAGE